MREVVKGLKGLFHSRLSRMKKYLQTPRNRLDDAALQLGFIFGLNPPMRIPHNLTDRYTLKGSVKVLQFYRDDRRKEPTTYTREIVGQTIQKVKSRQCGEYGGVDLWIYEALEKYPIAGKRVAVIGSADQGYGPWYECVCLAYGGMPTTVEYNDIQFEDSRLTAIHPGELDRSGTRFDAAFSFSSFEHDGLGRYGDPLNPDGDLEAMALWRSYLKPGGLMLPNCPSRLGQDCLQCAPNLRAVEAAKVN